MSSLVVISLLGCGKNEADWIEPPRIDIANLDQSYNSDLMSDKVHSIVKRDAYRIPNASLKQYKTINADQECNSAKDAFLRNLKQWQYNRSLMPEKITVPKAISRINGSLPGMIMPFNPDPEHILKYPDPTDIINYILRSELIEYRLSVSEYINREEFEKKLFDINQSLDEAHKLYGQLIPVISEKPSADLPISVPDIVVDRPETIIYISKYDDRPVSNRLSDIARTVSVNRDNSTYLKSNSFTGYNVIRSNALANVNKFLNDLNRKRKSGLL